MSQIKTVLIEADSSGDFSYSRHFVGQILGFKVTQGTLGTFDITVSDVDRSIDLVAVTGLTDDAWYTPLGVGQGSDGSDLDTTGDVAYAHPVVIGTLGITVANADANGRGFVRFLLA